MPLKITKDTALSLKRYAKCQTTPEWEVFIFEAQDKWEDLQAQATLKIMQEGGNSNDQDEMMKTDLYVRGSQFLQIRLV
jgi:hypothetical protein